MKFRLTDQFLWDLYNAWESSRKVRKFIFSMPYRRWKVFYDENPEFEKYRQLKSKRQFNNLIYYLKRHNFIKVKSLQGTGALMLTKKGIERAIYARFRLEKNNTKKRKDGKWIMVIFDIPQRRSKSRSLLRSILCNLGYKMFQQSVWITPYDVSEKTEELLQWYSLDSFVRIFVIEKLSDV